MYSEFKVFGFYFRFRSRLDKGHWVEGQWSGFSKLVIQHCQDSGVSVIVLGLAFRGIKGSGLLLRFFSEHLLFGLQDLSVVSF